MLTLRRLAFLMFGSLLLAGVIGCSDEPSTTPDAGTDEEAREPEDVLTGPPRKS